MTLYYRILEKSLNNQLLPNGITRFSSKKGEGQYNYREPQEAVINWLHRQEAHSYQNRQTTPQEAINNSPVRQVQSSCALVKESPPNDLINSPKQESRNLPSQPDSVKVTSEAIINCGNTPCPINALGKGAVAKIPVVLAELTIQLNVEATIDLPEQASEIKNMKKHLKITECTLLKNTNILFIRGFVGKKFEYSTSNYARGNGLSGEIRHCIVNIPFKCTTNVAFNGIEPAPAISNDMKEFPFFKKHDFLEADFCDQAEISSGDFTVSNQISTAFYNEMPFCEITNSRIVEFDEFLNTQCPASTQETTFNSIEEKMVIYLTLKILQYRQVAIPPTDS
ncbi:hypothetical protein BR63_01705 [Thermanaerosceptrum fracticalcis]|uniref:DUF3794 domain-containing protein n=1 Tax=Thermanaerosceptrum fracticalcis TaxID=1712410 RepID=A0A7G6DZ93_THEFR|nr:hypothetical protein [Thermanaerosceptrum fracticalcis]QNB45147.1 hypothetical protein BR63_01705 [Thermanaerosceptrum fracticalcis]